MIYNNYNWELLHLWCLKNPRNPNAWIVFGRIMILKLPVAHFKHYKCYFSATLKLNNQIIGGYNCMCIYSIHAITIYFLFPWKLNPFSFWKDYLWSLKEHPVETSLCSGVTVSELCGSWFFPWLRTGILLPLIRIFFGSLCSLGPWIGAFSTSCSAIVFQAAQK